MFFNERKFILNQTIILCELKAKNTQFTCIINSNFVCECMYAGEASPNDGSLR